MVKYEIARQKAVDAWLDATTPKPLEGEAAIVAQIARLREAARDRQRQETRRDWVGPAGDLAAAVAAVALPEATDAMREPAIETVWRVQRRARVDQFPISDNLSALMALVMADLSESRLPNVQELEALPSDINLFQSIRQIVRIQRRRQLHGETLEISIPTMTTSILTMISRNAQFQKLTILRRSSSSRTCSGSRRF